MSDTGVFQLDNREPAPGQSRLVTAVLEWVEPVVMAMVLVSILFTFVVRVITVDGTSMVPTYQNGDRVLVTGLGEQPEQGDVVIVVGALKDPIIKRVVATEGQVVDFDPVLRELTVDGEAVYGEVYGLQNGITAIPNAPADLLLSFPQTVPEGCVFVLGDNRQNSTDSRYVSVGMVDRRNILGKVVFNLYPFSRIGAAN